MRDSWLIGLAAVALCLVLGCNNQPASPAVIRGMGVNGYEFDYEMRSPSSILADAQGLSIVSGKTQIRVADGKLSVNGRPHGAVRPKDRISVVGGKVSVNGEERKPDAEPGAAPDPAGR
jgi:hypothetical protein